jgi:hypothetical protein
MKSEPVYHEEEPDPLVDKELTDITVDELIAKLKLSRQLVSINKPHLFSTVQLVSLKCLRHCSSVCLY